MIWLPNGDKISDWEKHMIQIAKLVSIFVWNPHEFQVVDTTPWHAKRRDIHGHLLYPKYSHQDRYSA
jgi:hypothetical protein